MKFNYRKIASVIASAVMVSSTMGFAAAASYPAPFVAGGTADAAIVVGASAQASDWAAAVDLSTDLSKRVSGTTTSTTTAGGDAKSLASGSNLVYLNDDLAENVQTITSEDLKTVLADGTFVDDEGTEYEYEQTIAVGTSTSNGLAFSDSGNDLDDPAVIVQLTDSASTQAYTLTLNFDEAVAFNATDSKGESLKLFGKDYTVGTSTDSDTLVLLGGASETTVNVGEKVNAEVSGNSYEVSLNAISDAATPIASISINGESKTFSEGQTKKVGGIDVYAKTVFRSGDNAGYVIMQLGSDKLTFENGKKVMTGSDNTYIKGTDVTITGGVSAMTKLAIKVSAQDSDTDHIIEGGSMKDPVFGTVSLDYVALHNGPKLEAEKDTSEARKTLALEKRNDRELGLSVTPMGSATAVEVPFVYQGALKNNDGNNVYALEGSTMSVEDYVILDSGDYQYLMQLTDLDLADAAGAKSVVILKDQLSGKECKIDSTAINVTAGTSTTCSVNSQVFTVLTVSSTTVKVYSSDYSLSTGSGHVAVFPYVELVSGKDNRFAYTDDVSLTNVSAGTVLELPTGTITLASNTTSSQTVGSVYYNISTTATGLTTQNITIGVSNAADLGSAGARETSPGILYMEDEDKTEATAGTENAVLLKSTDDGSFSEAATPTFSGAYDEASFKDSDFNGYLTNYGTYVLKNTADSDQTLTSLTYSTNGEQMYADVFISEVGASITPGSSGSGGIVQVYKDNESDMFKNKNIIVIGGSCINTVAAEILESTTPLCGADFTTKTKVGAGQYLIKSVASPLNANKIALLVAGYEATDTVNAVGKVKEGVSTDVGEKVYPELSS